MPEFRIIKATSDDANQIHELHTRSVRELCKDHYSTEQIDGWLKQRTPGGYLPGIEAGEMFMALNGRQIVGFGHAVPGEILAVFVAPEFIRQGAGALLLEHGIEIALSGQKGPIRLEATLNAKEFYEKAGFAEIERISVQRGEALLPVIRMELRKNRRDACATGIK
jgi:GNAT superfamily N-acetyltransferase